MQITAQLDDSYQDRIEAIQRSTQLNTSEIVRQALDLFYEKIDLTPTPKEKNQKLLEMLSGIGHGETSDGSVRYKEYVAEYLDEKFSHH